MPDIKDLKIKKLFQGIEGRYIHGNSMTLGEVIIPAGAIVHEHSHPHEQITFILEGELDMTIGGENVLLKPGMYYVIPSDTPHSGISYQGCKAIDVFHPVREDYRT